MWVEDGRPRPRADRHSRTSFSCGRRAEQGQAAVRGLPRAHRVPRRGARQPDRVGRLGGMTERERRALLRRRPNASWRASSRPPATRQAGPAPAPVTPEAARDQLLAGGSPVRRSPEVVHVAGERRNHRGGHLGVRHRETVAQQRLRSTIRVWSACSRSSPAVSESGSCLRSRTAAAIASSADSAQVGARPVDDEPQRRHPVLAQPFHEVRRLAQRVRFGGGDHEKRRTVRLEQLERLLRALAEPAEQRVEGGDERLHVAQHLGAEDLGQGVGDQIRSRPTSAWPDHARGPAAAG